MNNLKIIVIFLSALIFSGCAAQLHNIKSTADIKEGHPQSIVFGRLETAKAWLKTAYVLHIKNTTTSQEFEYAMRSWGCSKKYECNSQPFCFSLPPGQYKIARIDIMSGVTISNSYPDISFSVKPVSTVYIGTLSIGEETTEHNYLLWSDGSINLQILDEHHKDQVELADTCPGVRNMDYELSLMSLSEKNMVRDGKPKDPNADLLRLKDDKSDLGISSDEDYKLIPSKK